MRMTVEFTDVYDGEETVRVETIDVCGPDAGVSDDDLRDWAEEHLFPLTGDGLHPSGDAGYFAAITACVQCPALVGREFSWGV